MNLLEYLQIVLRRGWIMVLLAILAAGGAYVFSRQMTPVYRSSQILLIVPSRPDWGLQQAAVQLLNNRAEYLRSELVAQKVIDALRLDMTPGTLLGATTITAIQDNTTIQIDVDLPAPNPEDAARLLNPIASAWGDQLIIYQNELNQEAQRQDRVRAQIQDNPRLSLLRPNMTINTLIGALAGFFLGGVIVFVLEFLESSIIRRRDDVERIGHLPVLAAVPGD